MTDIEKERQDTIRKNIAELNAAGIDYSAMKSMAAKLFGPKQQFNHKSSKEVKNKTGHGAGDEEYLPPEGLDDEHSYGSVDDEISRSYTKKIHASLKCGQSLIAQKRDTSCIQGSRKSQRIQEVVGVCIEAVSIEPTPNLPDGTHVMIAQSSRAPHPTYLRK